MRAPNRRNRILAYSGPTLLATTVIVWIGLLLVGFALIAWPALGSAIRASQGRTPTDFVTALYYSGYSLTTLGTGDIVARTGPYRLIMIAEALTGFTTVTMALTYFLSVYGALVRRNTFALSLQHRSAGTGDAAELLARLGAGGDFGTAKSDIAAMGGFLLNVLETHRAYPVAGHGYYPGSGRPWPTDVASWPL